VTRDVHNGNRRADDNDVVVVSALVISTDVVDVWSGAVVEANGVVACADVVVA